MSNVPEYAAAPLGVARPRTSKAAVTSLVLGIVGCVPLVTSVAAIIFGAVGMKATRSGTLGGRGLAITGLVLGIIGVVGWCGMGAMSIALIAGSAAPRAVLHDFVGNVASGNLTATAAECDSSAIPSSDVSKLHDDMTAFGTYTDITSYSVNMYAGTGGETCTLNGQARFATGSHPFNAVLKKDASGMWRVWGFHIY